MLCFFYKFYSDVMTLPVLLQKENTGGLGSSILNLLDPKILLLMLNIPMLSYIRYKKAPRIQISSRFMKSYVAVMAIGFTLSSALGLWQSHHELKYALNRESLVKKLGIYQYGLYDIYLTLSTQVDYVLAEGDELAEIQNYLMRHPSQINQWAI